MRVILLFIFTLLSVPVYAYTYGGSYPDVLESKMQPVGYQYKVKAEPGIVVDRYIAPDYKNDPSVLISGRKEAPGNALETPSPRTVGSTPTSSRYIYVKENRPEDNVKVWYESDQ